MREAVRFTGPLKRATVCCRGGALDSGVLLVETTDVQPVAQPGTGRRHRPWRDHAGEAIHRRDDQRSEVTQGSAHAAAPGEQGDGAPAARFRAMPEDAAKARLARLHRRVAAIRRDATHKLTTRVTKAYAVIGIEDLNVRGMVRNRHLARAVSDGGFHEFRRQIEDKARLYGTRVVVAGRWYPSSKTCSCCGVIKETLALAERTFRCTDCSFEGRDVNAALNLAAMAASSAVSACGEARAGVVRKVRVKRASVKQEENTVLLEAA